MSNNRRDVTFWTEVDGEVRQMAGSSIEVSVNTEEDERMGKANLEGIKWIRAFSHNEDRDSNVVNGREYEVIGSPKENDMGGYVTVFDGEEHVNIYDWEIEDGDWKDVTEQYEDDFKTMRYEIGDYVKVISNKVSHGYNVGDVYRIAKIADEDSYWLEGHENVLGPFIGDHDLQYVPQEAEAEGGEEDVADYEPPSKTVVTSPSSALRQVKLIESKERERKYAMDAKVGAFMRHADGKLSFLSYENIAEIFRIMDAIEKEESE